METNTILETHVEQLLKKLQSPILSDDQKQKIESVREKFIQTYSLGKIFNNSFKKNKFHLNPDYVLEIYYRSK